MDHYQRRCHRPSTAGAATDAAGGSPTCLHIPATPGMIVPSSPSTSTPSGVHPTWQPSPLSLSTMSLSPMPELEMAMMNDYGRRAQQFWEQELPKDLAELESPETYFSTLGEEIAYKVDNLARALEGPDSPTEGYLEKVGRLRAAQQQAEERVMYDLVYSLATNTEQDEDETPDQTHPMADFVRWAQQDQARLDEQARESNEEADREWRERTGQPPL